MGANAFATGSHVALGNKQDLHTAAHEAAHVIQQQGGVQLSGGVGQSGDRYERHADQVADKVVRGESAEQLLDPFAGGGGSVGVQGDGLVVQADLGFEFQTFQTLSGFYEAEIDDAALRTLRSVEDRVAELSLARCAVSDRGLETVGRMRRLLRLDLRQTAVGDKGIGYLEGLDELRTLNLYGTQVTDACLDRIAELKKLAKVHLLGTRVTDAGVAKLRQRRPDLEVHHRAVVPDGS